MKMEALSLILLSVLVIFFISDYVPDKFALLLLGIALLATPFAYRILAKVDLKAGNATTLPGPDLANKARGICWGASAIALSQNRKNEELDRFEKELSYERLCKFSEALRSIGAQTGYLMYSIPGKSMAGLEISHCITRSIVIAWSSGRDEKEVSKQCEMRLKQIESLCSVIFPNCKTERLGNEELISLISSPLHVALRDLRVGAQPLLMKHDEHVMPVPPPPFSRDPSSSITASEDCQLYGDGPLIGNVYSSGRKVGPLSLNLKDIQRHASIFGTTGSGKSTTAISLALRLFSQGISVMILDWHGEHSEAVYSSGGKVFSPGSTESGLTINPLISEAKGDYGFQTEFITDVFSQVFQFTAPQAYMFREVLKACYRSKTNPSLSDLIHELGLLPIKSSWDHETRMALMRRLKLFTEGTCGMAVDGPDSVPRGELFSGLVSIDLSRLKDVNSRSIFANILLKLLYDHCVYKEVNSRLKHVVFIEEAHNVLPPRKPEMPRCIGERILSELRKFGEGVVVISQFPSSVSQEVVKNTSIRIIHAIRSGEDLRAIRESTSMSEEEIRALPSLCVGEAVVNMPSRSCNAFVKVIADPVLGLEISEDTAEVPLPSQA